MISELKQACVSKLQGDGDQCEVDDLRLIFMGKILKDDKDLNEYKIVDGSKMALIVRKTSGSTA